MVDKKVTDMGLGELIKEVFILEREEIIQEIRGEDPVSLRGSGRYVSKRKEAIYRELDRREKLYSPPIRRGI